MLDLQFRGPTAGIVLGSAEPGQIPLAVAGNPWFDRGPMHSKLARHLLQNSPAARQENRATGVPKIGIGRTAAA